MRESARQADLVLHVALLPGCTDEHGAEIGNTSHSVNDENGQFSGKDCLDAGVGKVHERLDRLIQNAAADQDSRQSKAGVANHDRVGHGDHAAAVEQVGHVVENLHTLRCNGGNREALDRSVRGHLHGKRRTLHDNADDQREHAGNQQRGDGRASASQPSTSRTMTGRSRTGLRLKTWSS